MNPQRVLQFAICTCLLLSAGCASNRSTRTGAEKLNVAALGERAQNGDRDAQRSLGIKYDFGHDLPRDRVEAAKWYQMAADQGDGIAQNNLGSLYQHGHGVATNYSKAVELYKKSAAQGFAMAQNSLGFMYDFGMGVPKTASRPIHGINAPPSNVAIMILAPP